MAISRYHRTGRSWVLCRRLSSPSRSSVSQGQTREEALTNIQEAILASLETRRAQGLPDHVEVREVEVGVV